MTRLLIWSLISVRFWARCDAVKTKILMRQVPCHRLGTRGFCIYSFLVTEIDMQLKIQHLTLQWTLFPLRIMELMVKKWLHNPYFYQSVYYLLSFLRERGFHGWRRRSSSDSSGFPSAMWISGRRHRHRPADGASASCHGGLQQRRRSLKQNTHGRGNVRGN